MKFSNWSFSGKLTAVNLAYLLPCAVLIFFLIKEKNNQVTFSEKEQFGVEYSRTLIDLLHHVGQHKIAGLAKASGQDVGETIQTLRGQIEKDFAALDEVDARHGGVLLFSDAELNVRKRSQASPQQLKASWNEILGRDGESTEQIASRHSKLIADLRTALTHVTDTSNLILDPDLDSYYLMDIIAAAVPDLLTKLQEELSFLLSDAKAEGAKLARTQLEILTYSNSLKASLDRLQGNLSTSISEDRNFYGTVPSLHRDMPDQMKDVGNRFNKIFKQNAAVVENSMDKGSIEIDEAQFEAMKEALDATHKLYARTSENLMTMLEIRVAQYNREKWQALGWTLLVWLIPTVISLVTVRRLGALISNAVAKLASQADAANRSSSQLAQASSTVSSGSTEQAAAIQETGASMSEMASMIARSASQASSSQELARRVTQRADEGCKVMERMVLAMDAIQEANSQLQNISTIIDEISTKTNVINDIVGKTQLLSFNASIEAARAGQHGRGFAVVAEEVGNLAQTSGNAAKSIRDLIEDSQRQVSHILKSTLERVGEGKVVTEKAQTIFSGITSDIGMISSQVESVSEAAREQQFGIEQISKAMVQMDQTTQSNNKAAHTAAQLSDQLAGQSQRLSIIARSVSELVFGEARTVKPKAIDSSLDGNGDVRPPETLTTKGPSEAKGRDELLHSIVEKSHDMDAHAANAATLNADDESFRKAV